MPAGGLEKLGPASPDFKEALDHAARSGQPTQHACPACETLLERIWIKGPDVEPLACPACRGTWSSTEILFKLRSYLSRRIATPAVAAEPVAEPPPDPMVVNWPVVGIVGAAVVSIFFNFRKPAPPPKFATLYHGPPAAQASPAPAPAPAPQVVEVPVPSGPSQADLRKMVQAELRGALKPVDRPDFTSEVDHPTYNLEPDETRVAVVVGVEKYPDLPAADYAAHDARAVRDHLEALGFPPRNILLLTDSEATKGKLAAALNSWLPKHAGKDSTVFFYYSGHGAPDAATSQAYLVPVDGEPEDLPDTAWPLKQLYAKLGGLGARHVVVALDSCFSGLGGRSVVPKGTRPLMTRVEAEPTEGRVTVLAASGPDQISGVVSREGHGAFTYFLLRGLNGEAADAGGRVTVSSLYRYLKTEVEDEARLQKRDQTPQMTPGAAASLVLR